MCFKCISGVVAVSAIWPFLKKGERSPRLGWAEEGNLTRKRYYDYKILITVLC